MPLIVDPAKTCLIGGELRAGDFGFFCSNGRKHVFHHLISVGSGTSMDIGQCEGDSCPLAQTHGLHDCQSNETCLDTRRITLDRARDIRAYIHPRGWEGRGKNRRRDCNVTIMAGGPRAGGWYLELAKEAEEADGLTSNRPHDWLERKRASECEANEKGHHWSFEDDAGKTMQYPDGRGVLYWDVDDQVPDDAVQRNCSHCRETQMKRPDGQWSGDHDRCPCCEDFPQEHEQYYCNRCSHGAPRSLVTQQERDYVASKHREGAGVIVMGVPADMRRK